MLLSKNPRIEEMLVVVLAKHPGLSVKELHERTQERYGRISIQAVYQELRKLKANAVVLQNKRRYSLALHWVLELSSFTDELYDVYTEPDVLAALPSEGQQLSWKFHSIASLVPVWTHLVLSMSQHSSERVCYEYCEHLFFHLCNSQVEERFLAAMQRLGVKHYLAVGSDSYLDMRYRDEIDTDSLYLHFGSTVLRKSSDRYISVLGPYLLRISFRPRFRGEIEEFFESVDSSKRIHPGSVAAMISQRTSINVSLSHDASEAEKVKKQFQAFFAE